MSRKNDDPIIVSLFNDIKKKKLVKNNSEIIEDGDVLNFKASFWSNNILYNSDYASKISKKNLLFILLHEIGHKKKFQRSNFILLISILFSFFLWFLIIKRIGIIFSVSTIIVFFILMFNIMRPFLRRDELDADSWAAKAMIQHYNISKPSEILRSGLKEFDTVKPSSSIFRLFLRIVYRLISYHPPNNERIKNIEELESTFSHSDPPAV